MIVRVLLVPLVWAASVASADSLSLGCVLEGYFGICFSETELLEVRDICGKNRLERNECLLAQVSALNASLDSIAGNDCANSDKPQSIERDSKALLLKGALARSVGTTSKTESVLRAVFEHRLAEAENRLFRGMTLPLHEYSTSQAELDWIDYRANKIILKVLRPLFRERVMSGLDDYKRACPNKQDDQVEKKCKAGSS